MRACILHNPSHSGMVEFCLGIENSLPRSPAYECNENNQKSGIFICDLLKYKKYSRLFLILKYIF